MANNVSPVVTPSLAPLKGIRGINDIDKLETFLNEKYLYDSPEESFEYDELLGHKGYRRMNPYIHIYEFNWNERLYMIKFSSRLPHIDLIKKEKIIYDQIKDFENKSFFIEDVEGGILDEGVPYEECAYIILPFITAISLENYIYTKDFSKAKFYQVISAVARGLLYLLSKGICHGDMHAGNILITYDTERKEDLVKIIDFDKAGACNDIMPNGLGFPSALRKDVNFIGLPDDNNYTGFFIMVKHIMEQKGISAGPIDSIIEQYKESNNTLEDIEKAYRDLILYSKGGRKTPGRRTMKSKRRISSSK
jgi:serine/threonine protein kinase